MDRQGMSDLVALVVLMLLSFYVTVSILTA